MSELLKAASSLHKDMGDLVEVEGVSDGGKSIGCIGEGGVEERRARGVGVEDADLAGVLGDINSSSDHGGNPKREEVERERWRGAILVLRAHKAQPTVRPHSSKQESAARPRLRDALQGARGSTQARAALSPSTTGAID